MLAMARSARKTPLLWVFSVAPLAAFLFTACSSEPLLNDPSAAGGNDSAGGAGGASERESTGGSSGGGGSTPGKMGTGGSFAGTGGGGAGVPGVGTGGRETGRDATGGKAAGGDRAAGGRAAGGRAAGGDAAGGRGTGGRAGSNATGGDATGGKAGGAAGGGSGGGGGNAAGGGGHGGLAGTNAGGSDTCDESAPPANVSAWIDESWKAEGRNNMSGHKTWLHDAAMKGKGEINICVRYGATQPVSAATRDRMGPAMERWFNLWFAKLYPYDCFPYPSVTVKITGWAVKPGQESLLSWSDGTVPIYTEVSDGTDQAKGEPKCPDTCGFFFHPDHTFTNCPGGADNHFDYTLWLNDKLPSGAAAEGSNWGVRIPVAGFLKDLGTENFVVMLHEIGHGFGISDYYNWKGSTPTGGSVMMLGTTQQLSVGDQWMVRRYWKETKALRYR